MTSREEREREIEEQMARTEPADLSGYALPFAMTTNDQILLAKGLTAFREGDFYLTHDLWEEAWHNYRHRDRKFLQGLIHIAVGCYHLQCRNAKGAHSQLGKAIDKITPFGPQHWGMDVTRVLNVVSQLRNEDLNSTTLFDRLQAVREAL
jgi:predicted metal-dependent hydrolase